VLATVACRAMLAHCLFVDIAFRCQRATFHRVFIKDDLGDCKGRTVEPARIFGHKSPFANLSLMTFNTLDFDDLMRFQGNCDRDSRADVCASPALATAPELQPDVKLVVFHYGRRLARRAKRISAKPSE